MIRPSSFLLTLYFFMFFNLGAQPPLTQTEEKKNTTKYEDSVVSKTPDLIIPGLKFSGYVDAYFGFYTDSIGINDFVKFPFVSPRSNHLGLNTAMFTIQYDAERYRGTIIFHFGDIPSCSWSTTFNPIMEAHAGLLLGKKCWLDAGFFRTHFGTEGLFPKENFLSSLAIGSVYEPFFESGLRLNYNPSERLALNFYILNGYNLFIDNNDKKSIGILVTYSLGDNRNIGYSNYLGDDAPIGDSLTRTRFHQNLFLNYLFKKLRIQVGGDFCIQENALITNINKNATMFSGIASLKYPLSKKLSLGLRGEIFKDPNGLMSGRITDMNGITTGYKLWGATLGMEYKHTENSYLRLEGRQLIMDKDQELFRWNNRNQSSRSEITLNLGVSF